MKPRARFSVAALAVCCSAAHAGTADIKASNNQLSVQAISTNVDYTETNDAGAKLDTEGGSVPGYAVSASLMKDWLLGNDYLRFAYSRNSGHTDYTGSYITGGAYGSVDGQSGATMTDYSLRWGKGYSVTPELMLTPYAEFGHHEWKRAVNQGETYTNSYAGIGGLAQFSPIQRLVISANALLGRTNGANIDVAGPTGFSGGLGSSTMTKVGLSLDYAFTHALHGNIGVDYSAFKYGRSANYLTPSGAYYYEPKSDSKYTTVSAGVGYAF